MDRRMTLQIKFEELLGSRNVYYEPPEGFKIKYPCIIYKRDAMSTRYADDMLYKNVIGYQVTVIDKASDSEIIDKIKMLPMCRWNRHFVSDNLNHDVFTLYY